MRTQRFSSIRPSKDLPEIVASLRRGDSDLDNAPGGRSWYAIRNVSASEAEIFIYDFIGEWGVSANDLVRELAGLRTNTITLRINSPGGDVFDGLAIYNAIRRHSATVNVFVDGLAASAASFIAMAGDTITMSRHSQMMIHEANGFVIGNAADMRKLADILDKSSDNIAAIYAGRAGGSLEDWRAAMMAETWYSDAEAVAAGLADSIDGEADDAPENRLAARAPHNQSPASTVSPALPPTPDPTPDPVPAPAPINWSQVFRESVRMAEEDLFAPVA